MDGGSDSIEDSVNDNTFKLVRSPIDIGSEMIPHSSRYNVSRLVNLPIELGSVSTHSEYIMYSCFRFDRLPM